MKKGQIDIFILVGIIILFGFMVILYINSFSSVKQGDITPVTSELSVPINNYIETCLEQTGKDALLLVGLQGGYNNKPAYYLDDKGYFSSLFRTVYISNNKDIMPSFKTIEYEISSYVNENLQYCIDYFKTFEDIGLMVTNGSLSADTTITVGNVIIKIDFPVKIMADGNIRELEIFKTEIPLRLDLLYKLAKNLTKEQIKASGKLCISCMIELGEKNDVYFEIIPKSENITLIAIEDNLTKINKDSYYFVFAFNHSTR